MDNKFTGSLEYIAGFFDGEGCVTISSHKRKTAGISHALIVTISNIDPRPLRAIMEIFGGHIAPQKNRGRLIWRWAVASKKAEKFLVSISDYSIVKKDEIIKALEFRELVRTRNGFPRLAPTEITERERTKKELSELKHRAWLM